MIIRTALACLLVSCCLTLRGAEQDADKSKVDQAVAQIEEVGGAVRYIDAKRRSLEVDFQFAGDQVRDEHLQPVLALPRVYVLRLKGTAVTDTGLAHVAKITTLQRLYLEETAVTDAGLQHLAALKNLEFLNLHSTKVTDRGIEIVAKLPKLKQLVEA